MNYKNDKVDKMSSTVSFDKSNAKKTIKYVGKNGKGYDGCGTHTHK